MSDLVGNSNCWFSHAQAHFTFSAAIECYKCGGLLSQDATCEDKFNPSGVSKVQCSGSCAKYKGEKDGMQRE